MTFLALEWGISDKNPLFAGISMSGVLTAKPQAALMVPGREASGQAKSPVGDSGVLERSSSVDPPPEALVPPDQERS